MDVPSAGTVGYQGYFGAYSDPNTRTFGQSGRFAPLVTLNAGGYFDPVTAQGMQRRVEAVNPYARLYRSGGSLAGRLSNLVVAFADAGRSASDPSAPEGSAFLKATAALGHLIGAGVEIQGYASLACALGGLGAGILNAADELAGQGHGWRGGRPAGRGITCTSHSPKPPSLLPPRATL